MARAVTYGMTLNVGTKSFIAPEVTSDDTCESEPDSESELDLPPPSRPKHGA